MIGDYYWTTGIRIYQQYRSHLWRAEVVFEDHSNAQLGGSNGNLITKYGDSLLNSVQTVKQDAEKLGIKFVSTGDKFHLYVCELFTNKPEIWQEIETVAAQFGFDVISCLP